MKNNDYKDGFVTYTMKFSIDDTDLESWDDGYLAFSNTELRINDKLLNGLKLEDILNGSSSVNGVEGYLMEVDLWRHEGGVYKEISIEREDRGFLVQRWSLHTNIKENEKPDGYKCYYRKVNTLPRRPIADGARLFGDGELQSVEVIVPKRRLHFFITIPGDRDNGKE